MLWRPPEGVSGAPIDVDPQLTRWLRPHQREGVQFMFDCVLGLRQSAGFGCILADDMGLGQPLCLHMFCRDSIPCLHPSVAVALFVPAGDMEVEQ